MSNIIEYVENEMKTFRQKGFNSLDSLVLSQLTYIKFERIVPYITDKGPAVCIRELLKAELFESLFLNVNEPEKNRRLLVAAAASPRFRDLKMKYYASTHDAVLEKQFAAVTYFLDDRTIYAAFRGTDTTLVGWKEDFNMAFISPVPSQESGVRYLEIVAKIFPRPKKIILGGHSKGGNIAEYAAIKCKPSVQERIISIYDHDGPGFKDSMFESAEFHKIKDRIHKTVPQDSLVGMLFENHENYSVVESKRFGIMQHDPFSWSVDLEKADFVYAENVSGGAVFMRTTLNEWLSTMTNEKRAAFIDTLFQLFGAVDGASENVFSLDWQKAAAAMLSAYKNVDAETKKMLTQTIAELVKLSLKNLNRSGK